jgi:hypothetical protein
VAIRFDSLAKVATPAIETGLTLSSVQWSITATILYTYVYQAMLGQQVALKHVCLDVQE